LPIFKYHCSSCGLQFGSMQSKTAAKDTLPCKKCGSSASRKVSAANFKFGHRPDAPGPQNTGASSIDHDVDVVIGRSAKTNLREYQKRADYKRRVIAANNTTGDHLSRLDDGEYFVMTEQERVAAKKARLKHQAAMKRITEYRKERRAYGVQSENFNRLSGDHEISDEAAT
jgi:putative FmdB family regulatory protein